MWKEEVYSLGDMCAGRILAPIYQLDDLLSEEEFYMDLDLYKEHLVAVICRVEDMIRFIDDVVDYDFYLKFYEDWHE